MTIDFSETKSIDFMKLFDYIKLGMYANTS